MPSRTVIIFLAIELLLPASLYAWDPEAGWLQLESQQRAARQALERQQQPPPVVSGPQPNAQTQAADQLRWQQQRTAQERLLENQRRRQLILNQRWRLMPNPPSDRAEYFRQQQQNLQEQRYQMNRFRLP